MSHACPHRRCGPSPVPFPCSPLWAKQPLFMLPAEGPVTNWPAMHPEGPPTLCLYFSEMGCLSYQAPPVGLSFPF